MLKVIENLLQSEGEVIKVLLHKLRLNTSTKKALEPVFKKKQTAAQLVKRVRLNIAGFVFTSIMK